MFVIVETVLQEWTEFSRSFDELTSWMSVRDSAVRDSRMLRGSVSEKKKIYEEFRLISEEISEKSEVFEHINKRTDYLQELSPDVTYITEQNKQLQNHYAALCIMAKVSLTFGYSYLC